MADGLRLFTDEDVSARVTAALLRLGVDVLTAKSASRLSRPDEEHLAYAASVGRVFVTHDKGVRDTHWRHQPHAGVLFVPQELSARDMVDWLEMAAAVLSSEEMFNRLEVYRP